jgi:hypothetical protein
MTEASNAENSSFRLRFSWQDLQGNTGSFLGNARQTAMAKIPKTPKDTAPYDPPAYATFSDDDVASISKFIQTGLLQMLR